MKRRAFFLRAFSVLGPGLLAALADNDAGGVISYAVTGAKFGYSFFFPVLCGMIFLTYTVQELSMRLGVSSNQSFHTLVQERFGRGWMVYQLVSLLVENLLTLVTEFIGMSAGLMVLGFPLWLSVLFGAGLVLSLSLIRGYRTKEKVAILVGLSNLVFLVLAFLLPPDWYAAGQSFLTWNHAGGSARDAAWYLAAMIGNGVAPWMIFYQNSAYAARNSTNNEVRKGRIDTAVGCIVQTTIAFAILLIGASLYGLLPQVESAGPAELIGMLGERFGSWASLLFGLGLFNAGLLAAATVSLSSSWSVAQSLGWSKSQNDTLKESPKFYAIYFGSVLLAALLVLLPGLPLNRAAVLTQVLSGVLLTPVLVFLLRFTSDKTVMGALQNTRFQRIRGWFAVGILSTMSLFAIILIFL